MFRPAATWKGVLLALCLLSVVVPQARAAVLSASVAYREIGGPRDASHGLPVGDLFTITNSSDVGELSAVTITLNSGLVFDTDLPTNTAGTAPGFPFVSSSTDPVLTGGSIVADGSKVLALTFSDFSPGESFSFHIDVDRTGQHNDNQNRHVIGNRLGGIFTAVFVGSFPESPVTASQKFGGSGQTASGFVSVILVPEPASVVLGAIGIMVLAAWRWRRNR